MWFDRCAWVQGYLPLLADDELFGADRRRVERHLIGCPSCRRCLASHRETLGVLRLVAGESGVSPDAPSLWPSLSRQIAESRRPGLSSRFAWMEAINWSGTLTWGAASLFVGLLGLTWQFRTASEPTTRLAEVPTPARPPAIAWAHTAPATAPAHSPVSRPKPASTPVILADGPAKAPGAVSEGGSTSLLRGFDLDRKTAATPESRETQPSY